MANFSSSCNAVCADASLGCDGAGFAEVATDASVRTAAEETGTFCNLAVDTDNEVLIRYTPFVSGGNCFYSSLTSRDTCGVSVIDVNLLCPCTTITDGCLTKAQECMTESNSKGGKFVECDMCTCKHFATIFQQILIVERSRYCMTAFCEITMLLYHVKPP